MIELKELRKSYKTGDLVQKALDGVSLNFRENEFVAVLGPSGSGKTTLLNILGGLDHADSGDIVINGTSTQDYRSADWDTYRNHRVGFIFQSYNLIAHQTILSNVELALTLSGVGRAERRRRAEEALRDVGLAEHIHKLPAQLSGGQMQRVAIARALVNNPDIVLADEPTGALDTETGRQVMDILKKVADDRLVVMVTHNPDLAEEYATRIVRLADGRITDDSRPFSGEPASTTADSERTAGATAATAAGADAACGNPAHAHAAGPAHAKRASMSFFTALALSFNNLMTKKGRTFLTAFAGSIGIIGIAAILSLSNGVNNYIADTEEEALTSYPLTITKSSFDLSSLMAATMGYASGSDSGTDGTGEDSGQAAPASSSLIPLSTIMTDMFAKVKNNDLSAFKEYLESDESGIEPYVNTIQCQYGIEPRVYASDTSEDVVQLSPSSMSAVFQNGINTSSFTSGSMSMSSFSEMLDDRDILEDQMEVVMGRWPESYDEVLFVLSPTGAVSDYTLYSLGVYDPKVMEEMTKQALNGEEVAAPEVTQSFTYDDAMQLTFKVVPACALYQKNQEAGSWTDMSEDDEFVRQCIEKGVELKVVGVAQPRGGASSAAVDEGIAYTSDLTQYLMQRAAESEIVQQQMDTPEADVFTGKTFEELQDDQGRDFDVSSIFTVDEDAIKNAFSFDADALDMGDMDLSDVDLSGMNLDMSSVDLSNMNLSGAFDDKAMAALMKNAPQPDFSALNPEMTKKQQEAMTTVSGQISSGFIPYAMAQGATLADLQDTEKMQTYWANYLETEEVQKEIVELNTLVGAGYGTALQTAMSDYMSKQFAPYMEKAIGEMMSQAAKAMATSMAQSMAASMTLATKKMGSQLSSTIGSALEEKMSGLSDSLQDGFSVDTDAFANAIQVNMTQEDLTSLLTNYMNADELTYDENLAKLGYASNDKPESISIYPIDFAAKEEVLKIVDAYNQRMEAEGSESKTIQYSDIAGTLMSSVTDIVNMISLVLIAFVSISLVVSSIMIGIITYISVLERKKEIGILRAMGASKFNIANVFNAETIIEGLIAGVFAILVVVSVSVPVNEIVLQTQDVPQVMILPWESGVALIGVSVLLTFIAGLSPSSKAARRDPVEALRSE